MSAKRWTAALVIGLLATAPGALAGELSHEPTSTRSFDNVGHWVSVFDAPERDSWQKPEKLVEHLQIRSGQRVADLGAGTGYLLPHLSPAVGDTGAVLAIDTEPSLVEHLRARSEKTGLANVTPILASANNPRIPPSSVDLVLILDTYHHIGDRVRYVRDLKSSLRPGGRIAIIDWRKRELPVGPPPDHKLSRDHVVAEMTEAGFDLLDEPEFLPNQYVLTFRPSSEK